MKFTHMINSVEAHAAGAPSRIVTGGFPFIPGSSISEKVRHLKHRMDHLRTMLLYEPRGHAGMSVVLVISPTVPEADVGMIVMEPVGYVPMSGTNTIAACTVLVETGMVNVEEPETKLTLDTLAGLVQIQVSVKDGKATGVTFQNVPAFSYLRDVKLSTPRFKGVSVDIAYGGMYYVIVAASDVGLTLRSGELDKVIEYGREIRNDVIDQVDIRHPGIAEDEHRHFGGTVQVYFHAPPTDPRATFKNVVFMPPSTIDRSPCGTGTSAWLANLHAKGELKIGERVVNEGYIGTLFGARIVGEARVGDYPAVIPEITGSANITAVQQFVVDSEDELIEGFLLS